MCEPNCQYNAACSAPAEPYKGRLFTVLLLYCWQREYDKRPYKDFQFRRLEFEERMHRKYHVTRDLRIITKFLHQRPQHSVSISSIFVGNLDSQLLKEFAKSLLPVSKIELKFMRLPLEFFVMLRLNADKMQLKELSLEGTFLLDQSTDMLREFLLANKMLHSLNVSCCGVTQFNFATIADGVHKCPTISSFHCNRLLGGGVTLDTEKIASIVGSLLMQNKLVELSMQQCEFTALDMQIFEEYLAEEKCTLRKLSLAFNIISSDGTMFLMRGIAKGGVLELLDIRGNDIGTHGAEWVAKYLSSCLMLQHLYLDNNRISAVGINLMLLTLKKRCRVLRLQIYGNEYDSRTAMILRRLLDAEVLLQEQIDLTYTYDEALKDYRVLPWR